MQAGDCLLQPPLIRHRVMESSAGAEVVEICAPAQHITIADRSMALPNGDLQPGRDFDGQQFVFHVAANAAWAPWRVPGYQVQDTGIGAATAGLAGVRVVRSLAAGGTATQAHASEFCFYFVLSGTVNLHTQGQSYRLASDDSITLPDGVSYALTEASDDLTLLEVTLPAELHPSPGHQT
jgi:mannose-6-phosphate isomerase-like protein (cupin superfamily)